MENSRPFSFYSALRYSLHLLCSVLSAISENFSHKDGQHCRNAVEKNRKQLSTGQWELRVFPTKKSLKMKMGFVVTRSLSFYIGILNSWPLKRSLYSTGWRVIMWSSTTTSGQGFSGLKEVPIPWISSEKRATNETEKKTPLIYNRKKMRKRLPKKKYMFFFFGILCWGELIFSEKRDSQSFIRLGRIQLHYQQFLGTKSIRRRLCEPGNR